MELRKDYILNRWVIISEKRGQRPHEFHSEEAALVNDPKKDFFAPGNEATTPPEIYRDPMDNWQVRVFPNKFPFASLEGQSEVRTDNEFYTFSGAYGRHEVVVETRDSDKQLWDLDIASIARVLKTYKMRVHEIYKTTQTKYVMVFKNHGKEGGTSILHSHTQIVSTNIIPPIIEEKIRCQKSDSGCNYCKIIEKEKNSRRRVLETEHFISFTPYASRFNYELLILSKAHKKSMIEFTEDELDDLAKVMHFVLNKLKKMGCAYNIAYHDAPPGSDLHFQIEIMPRIAKWAGYELGTGIIVNAVSPETAAEFYRS